MLTNLAHNIIKYRLPLVIILFAFTAFMGYVGKDIEMSYNFAKVVPPDDEDMIYFQEFKDTFGEDGTIVVIGVDDSSVYTNIDAFRKYEKLTQDLEKIEGVEGLIAFTNLFQIVRDDSTNKFKAEKLLHSDIKSEQDLKEYIALVKQQKFYDKQILNEETGASLIALTLEEKTINSIKRNVLMKELDATLEAYNESSNFHTYIAGLPYLRGTMTSKVGQELKLFLALSLSITALILFFFFRSFFAVFVPLVIIAIMVVWSLGTIVLCGYQITLLTGLIPPIIVVIGIPNSVYLLNKYHREFRKHGNKIKALSLVIRRIGVVTLITNLTTAIGFFVFSFTEVSILHEFGIVASINIMGVFISSMILIPAIFAYLPEPKSRELKHLDFKFFHNILEWLDVIAHSKRRYIYMITIVLVVVSAYGVSKINTISFMVDDVPNDGDLVTDLKFFEANFGGVMPLEVVVDTKKKKGVMKLSNLKKIDKLQTYMSENENISQGISLATFVKALTQGFYKGSPDFYRMPNNQEKNFILKSIDSNEDKINITKNFTDSTGQIARITFRVKDIGSDKIDSLVKQVINPQIDSIFAGTDLEAKVTGTTVLFLKGNNFLVNNLQQSLVIAFILIALLMAALFGNFKMILISLTPNVVPLIITGGIMGYFGIPLKPSTAIIFSIAFGIAVDDSIHYLAKYRQELFQNNFNVAKAVSISIKETGSSMIYTSIILFFGFIIFTFSSFGGTIALGLLTSITLLFAMVTNLTLLPCLIMSFDDGNRPRKKKMMKKNLIDHYDEELDADPELDAEIDLDLLDVKGEGEITAKIYDQKVEELRKKKNQDPEKEE